MQSRLTNMALIVLCWLVIFACKKDPALIIEPQPTPVPVIPPHSFTPYSVAINSTIGGFYIGLPASYNETQKSYPLLIALHGGGQFGNGHNDLPLLLNDGIPQLLDEKKFPAEIKSNDTSFSFIVMAPQFSRYPSVEEIMDVLTYASKNYRVDIHRIYLTGLSLGGTVTCDVAAAYPSVFAAIVPISGVSSEDIIEKSRKITATNMPVWIFHNSADPIVSPVSVTNFNSALRSFTPVPLPRITIFNSAIHDAWTKAIDPSYRENGMNMYEWMAQYHR